MYMYAPASQRGALQSEAEAGQFAGGGLDEALCFAGGQAVQPLRPLAVAPGARMYAYAMASPHEEDITGGIGPRRRSVHGRVWFMTHVGILITRPHKSVSRMVHEGRKQWDCSKRWAYRIGHGCVCCVILVRIERIQLTVTGRPAGNGVPYTSMEHRRTAAGRPRQVSHVSPVRCHMCRLATLARVKPYAYGFSVR